jgi:DNA-binding NarL/FixJ family response regulator
MAATRPISVLSVDDHPLLRAGLKALLETEGDLAVVAEASNGEEALEAYRATQPDVVLLDLSMPVMDGLDAAKAILAEFTDAKIVMLTTYDGDEDIYRALDAGVRGYLLKDMLRTEIVNAIRAVADGRRSLPAPIIARVAEYMPRVGLTARELEVLAALAKGYTNAQIGSAIGRTEGTVKVHVRNILRKLGVEDRTQAVTIALRRGFIRLE